MRVLITGICGFVGSTLARGLVEGEETHEVLGIDNLVRPGSELNRSELRRIGIRVIHGDLRSASDLEGLPAADVVIDAAANSSVLAGVDGNVSTRQIVEHNLNGTVNILEYCSRYRSTLVLLSTSRVYSIRPLLDLPLEIVDGAFAPDPAGGLPPGITPAGVGEGFSVTPPLSLYGATKLASETLALEYGEKFDFPVWVNRCGVLAGAGQFGRPDQGICTFWINAWLRHRPLSYIGFGGHGYQVRDCLHPNDLLTLIEHQISSSQSKVPRVVNVSGGMASSMSLRQLSAWCTERMGRLDVGVDLRPRPFDIPWIVLDSTLASEVWGWRPSRSKESILEEILAHAEENPEWLDLSEAR